MSSFLFYSTRMRKKLEKNPFFWSPVSRIVPKNAKGGSLGVFEHPFFCKIEKNEGGPFGDIKKIAKKVSQSRNNQHKKIFGQGRDSNPRPSAW